MTNTLYVYHLEFPMDFGWAALPSLREFAGRIISGDDYAMNDDALRVARHILALADRAAEVGGRVGWQGDYRNQPSVVTIPDTYSVKYAIAWKQDNNGETFVVSEVP